MKIISPFFRLRAFRLATHATALSGRHRLQSDLSCDVTVIRRHGDPIRLFVINRLQNYFACGHDAFLLTPNMC